MKPQSWDMIPSGMAQSPVLCLADIWVPLAIIKLTTQQLWDGSDVGGGDTQDRCSQGSCLHSGFGHSPSAGGEVVLGKHSGPQS